MELVIYGDFNCPYSCLASARADALVERGVAAVEWRAVEHDPSIPAPSEPVDGDLATMLDREVAEVRGLLRPGEVFPISRPPVHPNSAASVAAFASSPPDRSHTLRRRVFEALWFDGRDIGDRTVLAELGAGEATDTVERAAAWRDEWLRFDRRVVPMLVLPDGYVSRGWARWDASPTSHPDRRRHLHGRRRATRTRVGPCGDPSTSGPSCGRSRSTTPESSPALTG